VDDCEFVTSVPRARTAHLLRVHQLLYQPYGRPPLPLPAAELRERLEALRRRQRSSRQRRRDAARQGPAAACHSSSTRRSVGSDSAQPTPGVGQVAGVPSPAPDLEEDWGSAVVDVLDLDQEDWDRELGGAPGIAGDSNEWQLVPYIAPEEPIEPEIPGGLDAFTLARLVWSDARPLEEVLDDVDILGPEERPLLQLFARVAITSGRYVASAALSGLTTDVLQDPTGTTALSRLLLLLLNVSQREA